MMNMKDEWNGLADFLTGVIEKYAEKIDLESLPDPDKYYKTKQMKEMYVKYMRLSTKARPSTASWDVVNVAQNVVKDVA